MADYLSYSEIKRISNMSVDEYLSEYGNLFGIGNPSTEEVQAIIDRMKEAINAKDDYTSTWSDLADTASESYDKMYDNSLSYLEMSANVTDEQWDEAYNASVSDNYATGDVDGLDLSNVTIEAGDDGVEIDWSELQTMKKTKLTSGEFKRTTDWFDDSAEIGDTKNVCGGTITYLGKKNVTYDRGNTAKWYERFAASCAWKVPILGNLSDTFDARTEMVHYEGVLGSFDYDASQFALGYWTTEVNGNTVQVPCLHYINDGATTSLGGMTFNGFLDGEYIEIPEGLKSLDYTFADTGIMTMPEIPDSVESAHCAFMDCKQLIDGCDSAKISGGIYDGKLTTKSNLKDTSWMFSGCTNMQNYFSEMNSELIDARYMYSECKSLGWDGQTLDENGDMVTSFTMPSTSALRYTNAFWLQNMFDGCDDAVIKKVADYLGVSESDILNGEGFSEWTDEDGTHHNTYDKLIDGSYDEELSQDVDDETSRGKILKLIDKNGNGLTGVASDTAGLASYGVQTTENGSISDDSVWAKFRQSDFEATYGTDNQFGDILNHAIPFVGTYAVSKAVLNSMTDGKHKFLTTAGALAVAVVPQVVGYGDTLTPVLDWTANAVGSDTKVGQFLTEFSQKLKGQVTYHTAVSELDTDDTFDSLQESATDYASNQVAQMLTSTTYEGENTIIATKFDISSDMQKNGEYIASDANLLFIACEPEENLKTTLSDSIMSTSIEALRDKMELEIEAAGDDSSKIEEIRQEYSNDFMTLLYNVNVYDDAAKSKLENLYAADPELKAQAMNGLEKVMRCTATPLYEQMYELQSEWEEKYGTSFFTDKQLNDSTQSTKTMSITGLGTFNDFDPDTDYTDQSDVYVEKMETYQKALTLALSENTDQDSIDALYAAYYETAYGWALDEAESHGVLLDAKRDATTADKNTFLEYVERIEAGELSDETTVSLEDTDTVSETGTAIAEDTKTDDDTEKSKEQYNRALETLGIEDEDVQESENELVL